MSRPFIPETPSNPWTEALRLVLAFLTVLFFLTVVLVALRGWPPADESPSVEEQRRTRHAVCELLDAVGADSTSAADVDACTFGGDR